jgi:hypothetical protein
MAATVEGAARDPSPLAQDDIPLRWPCENRAARKFVLPDQDAPATKLFSF